MRMMDLKTRKRLTMFETFYKKRSVSEAVHVHEEEGWWEVTDQCV